MSFRPRRSVLERLYRRMLAAYGPQGWWPADSPFEVLVGAVLTQNAAWGNVEQAIGRLRAAGALDVDSLLAESPASLAELIRPSGYFRVKERRLRALVEFVAAAGGMRGLATMPTADLRAALLGVHGVGPETADDILLYALQRPVFVIDAYTRRLLARYALAVGDEPYEQLRAGFEAALPAAVPVYGEYHALIVRHAKVACRKTPLCAGCVLRAGCAGATGG